jgi:hypothetical protein
MKETRFVDVNELDSMAALQDAVPTIHKRVLQVKLSNIPMNPHIKFKISCTLAFASPEVAKAAMSGCTEQNGKLFYPRYEW